MRFAVPPWVLFHIFLCTLRSMRFPMHFLLVHNAFVLLPVGRFLARSCHAFLVREFRQLFPRARTLCIPTCFQARSQQAISVHSICCCCCGLLHTFPLAFIYIHSTFPQRFIVRFPCLSTGSLSMYVVRKCPVPGCLSEENSSIYAASVILPPPFMMARMLG